MFKDSNLPDEAMHRRLRDRIPAQRVARTASWLQRSFFGLVPAFDSLRRYRLHDLRADLIAGLTVAAIAVPQAMAYATIAGIPAQYGLYTAIVMTAVGALLDSSRQLINGPTNAISIALLSAIGAIGAVGDQDRLAAAVLMAFLVGVIQTGITLFRLGDLTRYVSHAVIVGFTVGAGTLLVLDQLKNLLGLPGRGEAHDHFLKRFWLTLTQLGDPEASSLQRLGQTLTEAVANNGWTVALGLGTIVLVVVFRWFNGWWGRRLLPELLLAVIGMAVLVWALNLDQRGVRVIGDIPAKLPAFDVPTVRWELVRELAGSALAIAVLGLLEAIAMAKAIAARTGQKLDINQQCLSEGLANLSGSFFQCFPGSGSLTRSAINQQAGAVTQWSGVFSAGAVAATVLLFAPLARYIPHAALAGILIRSAWRIVDKKQLVYHLRATRFDAGIVCATAAAAVFISVEFCILIGVFLSFMLYVPRAARVHMAELTITPERVIREKMPSDPPCGRILIFNLEGELFFGSAPDLEKHFATIDQRAKDGVRVVVLRTKRARNPDAVCLQLLGEFIKKMEERGLVVLLCGVRRDLYKGLRNTGLALRLGQQRIFRESAGMWFSTRDAVRYAYELLGNDYCTACPRRYQKPQDGDNWYYMI